MKKALFILGIIVSISANAQSFSESLIQDSITRTYYLHLPTNYAANMPLVINLHGYTSEGWEQEFYTGMSDVADSNDFVVVYPDGLRDENWVHFWNCAIEDEIVNDVNFISLLIDTLIERYQVDSSRIYVTGMSNGGFMSHYLACELSEKIAAIASITGSMNDSVFYNCNPTRAIPVMHMHGTADSTVPYLGIDSNATVMGQMHPIEDIIALWENNNNCLSLDSTLVADIDTTDGSHAIKYTYSNCDDDSEVVFYKFIDGGHTWPNAVQLPWQAWVNRDIKGSQTIWDWFKNHSINYNTPTPVEEINFASLIYPNPAKNDLTISNSYTGIVSIYNMMGMEVATYNKQDVKLNINVSNLSSGAYYITCNRLREKFIKL